MDARLKAACPGGVDVFLDDAHGDGLARIVRQLAANARVVLCGLPEAYEANQAPSSSFLGALVNARATLKGLVIQDHLQRLPELVNVVGGWIRAGQFRYKEDLTDGLAHAPQALDRLMRGETFGTPLVRVALEHF
jgi:NADPH-dependent curcumin reductase CurA